MDLTRYSNWIILSTIFVLVPHTCSTNNFFFISHRGVASGDDSVSRDRSELPTSLKANQSIELAQLPATKQSRCQFRWVHWANFSSGHPSFLNRNQTEQLFRIPVKRSKSSSVYDHHLSTSDTHGSDCYLLFIYAPTCPFSMAALPFVRALARAYPQIPLYAVHVQDYVAHRWSLRVLFVPKLKLLINGRIFREYTGLDTNLDSMIDFVWSALHELPKGPIHMKPEDFHADPQTAPSEQTSFLLLSSWIVTLASLGYLVLAFGSNLEDCLSGWLHRLSGGRFGRVSPNQVDSGVLQTWDPGQMAAFH